MNPIGIWFKTDRALPAKKSENPNPGESSAPLSQAINTNMVHYMGVLLIEGPIARGNLSSFHLKSVQFTTVSFPQPPHREIRYGIVMIGVTLEIPKSLLDSREGKGIFSSSHYVKKVQHYRG